MSVAHLLAFNAALLAALLSPGPALLVTVRAAVTGGRTAGIAVGLGLGTMAALWTLAALLGLDTVFTIAPWSYVALKVMGGGYLIWLAVQAWRSAGDDLEPTEISQARSFVSGLLVNFANPKSVLFAAAVLVVIFPPDLSLGESLLVAANHVAMEWVFYTLVAVTLSSDAVAKRYFRLKPVFDRVSGLMLGGLGLRLILDRS